MAKKIFIFLLAAVLLFAFAGCHMFFVNEEKDAELIVAKVNGVEIKKAALLTDYHSYRSLYNITDANENSEENRETVEAIKTQIFDELMEYEVIVQKMTEMGIELITQEQQAELDENVETRKESILNTAKNAVEEEAKDKPQLDAEAEIQRRVQQEYDYVGITDGSYRERLLRGKVRENLKAYLGKDYEVSEEDLKIFYDENLEAQKRDLDASPKNLGIYESVGYALYVPEGMRYVKNLLIAIPEDKQKEITDLRLDSKNEEADALRDQELAKIKAEADEVYQKAKDGEDFDQLVQQYGDDPGMETEPRKTKGYRIYEGLEDFAEEFVTAGMALKAIGDISEPAATDFGYHILLYASDEKAGERSFEETKEGFYAVVKEELVGRLYEETVDIWMEEAEIVEYRNNIF